MDEMKILTLIMVSRMSPIIIFPKYIYKDGYMFFFLVYIESR